MVEPDPDRGLGLMAATAICSILLLGYGARNGKGQVILHMVLPLVVSISFLLIADIDSPRGGIILINPQNLANLMESLRARRWVR
jgi:hypothetical protein